MAGNIILTDDVVTREAAVILENTSVISRTVNRQYDDMFANEGAKIGATARIRLPDRVTVKDGAALGVEDENQQYVTLSIDYWKHVDVSFTGAQLTLSLDNFSELVLKPRISQLATAVDLELANAYKYVYTSVGTPGTTPATSAVLLAAEKKLNDYAAPEDMRYAAINTAANASLVEGMKGLFSPADVISRQFKKGLISTDVLGFAEFGMSQNIRRFTTGTRSSTASLTVSGTISTQGQSTISIAGDSGSATVTVGDVFTVANVYSVNPQSRESSGDLQQFVVTAANVASSGTFTNISVSPAMYTSGNALATIDAFPQNGAAVVFMGAPNTSYVQNLVYQKDAITMASVDLFLPKNTEFAGRATHNGISISIVKAFDINNYRLPCRADTMFGYKVYRPELACRLWG